MLVEALAQASGGVSPASSSALDIALGTHLALGVIRITGCDHVPRDPFQLISLDAHVSGS